MTNARRRSSAPAARRFFSITSAISCATRRQQPGVGARRLCADARVGPEQPRRRRAADRHRQRHRHARARLCRGAVQDRRYAARPRVRGGAGRHAGVHLAAFAVADAASAHHRLPEGGLRVRPLVDFQRPVGTEREARNRGVHGRASGARRDAGGSHPDAHPSDRGDGCGSRVGSRIPTAQLD